ncbi:hypothetical protein I5498_11980 [Citrobacter amalonaticus]|uniref:gp53-like domain-containing protein n=2 Tax=Citrobacter amalonaticus TaxID=35703 RepID=UPI001906B95B|nr:hypothetical protein [Citrobacter amalonaticus]MBJ9318511.1 hypothetical protein [Citrobacter amalonaticus]
MHRIDTVTAQKDKFGAGKNGFTRGNPQTGTPATDLDDDYFDMLQEELCAVVEESDEELDKGKHNQLLTALRALLLSRANPFGDIASDGPEAIAMALENLGLGTAALRDVGTGENQIPDMSAWASGEGWRRTPDGYIEQWGTLLQDSNVTQTLLFPIPFLNKVENICLTETTQSTSTSNVSAWGFNKDTLTLSSVTVINSKTNTGEWLYWRAIGK